MKTFIDYDLVILTITLIGGFILLFLDIYLRKRDVNDPTLMWIYLAIFSWSIRSILTLGGNESPQERSWFIYFISPASNILFTIAAFNYSRLKEIISFQKLKNISIFIVIILSIISLVLLKLNYYVSHDILWGSLIDIIPSLISIFLISFSISYSFLKYQFKYFFWLTLMIFLGMALGQILFLIKPLFEEQNAQTLTNIKAIFDIGLILLLVSHPFGWALSNYAKLNVSGKIVNVPIVALHFDLRGSTKWVKGLQGDGYCLIRFINHLRNFLLFHISKCYNLEPSLVKFLGDGYLFVWEFKESPSSEILSKFSKSAEEICVSGYKKFISRHIDENWKGVPNALGCGLDSGTAWRITLENGSHDYVGDTMNLVSKLQELAKPNGGVVITGRIMRTLNKAEARLFPKTKHIQFFSGEEIDVFTTEGVEFPKTID